MFLKYLVQMAGIIMASSQYLSLLKKPEKKLWCKTSPQSKLLQLRLRSIPFKRHETYSQMRITSKTLPSRLLLSKKLSKQAHKSSLQDSLKANRLMKKKTILRLLCSCLMVKGGWHIRQSSLKQTRSQTSTKLRCRARYQSRVMPCTQSDHLAEGCKPWTS